MKQPLFVILGVALACATILARQAQPPQSYQRFLGVMSGCTEVQIARRNAA